MNIWPSLLAANLLNLESQITALMNQGISNIHLDIMDNHYVPNLSFGPDFCAQIKKRFPSLNIDVHLMISPVSKMIEQFAKSGASRIAIHADSEIHLNYQLQQIKQLGCETGLAINPEEGIEHLQWIAPYLDFVLLMTVNPGFGGQKMIQETLGKIKLIKTLYPNLSLTVDGGVDLQNIGTLKKLGVDEIVVGSALFQANNFPDNIIYFKHQMASK